MSSRSVRSTSSRWKSDIASTHSGSSSYAAFELGSEWSTNLRKEAASWPKRSANPLNAGSSARQTTSSHA